MLQSREWEYSEETAARWLQYLVVLTNEEARKFTGMLNTCILSSYALSFVMQRFEIDARVLRVEAAIFPDNRKDCTILGRQWGPAAKPGEWVGHVAVLVDRTWLCDPTVDQGNKDEWPRDAHVGPLVVRLNEKFWQPRGLIMTQVGGSRVRYILSRQNGFARAGAARPSQWRPLAERILDKLEARNEKPF